MSQLHTEIRKLIACDAITEAIHLALRHNLPVRWTLEYDGEVRDWASGVNDTGHLIEVLASPTLTVDGERLALLEVDGIDAVINGPQEAQRKHMLSCMARLALELDKDLEACQTKRNEAATQRRRERAASAIPVINDLRAKVMRARVWLSELDAGDGFWGRFGSSTSDMRAARDDLFGGQLEAGRVYCNRIASHLGESQPFPHLCRI